MKDLLAYLFGSSQVENEVEETKSAIERIMEEAEEQEPLKVERKPLQTALKALDISGELEYDPEGFSLVCGEEADYRRYTEILLSPDAMEKLAKLGWVVTRCGDVAMSNEPAEFRIRFIEVTTAGEDNSDKASWPAPNPKLVKGLIKKGREFMDEPGPHDEESPVEYDDKTSDDNQKGVGKAQDGKDPEGKPKGSAKSEALELAEEILVNEEERCPHCEGQGYVDDEGNPKNEDMAAGDPNVHKCPRCQGRKVMPKSHATRYKGGVERKVSQNLGKPWKFEARHKAGCQCGFCKNMGSLGKKKKDEPKTDDSEQEPEGFGEAQEQPKATEKQVPYVDKHGKQRMVPWVTRPKAQDKKEESQRVALKRPFWGHKPGTKGKLTPGHSPDPVNKYTGKLRLKGSPPASVTDKDKGDLYDPTESAEPPRYDDVFEKLDAKKKKLTKPKSGGKVPKTF